MSHWAGAAWFHTSKRHQRNPYYWHLGFPPKIRNKSHLSSGEHHRSHPALLLQPPTPGAKPAATQRCWHVQKSMRDPSTHLRERQLNTPPCLLENSLWCFPKIIVLMRFAFLESPRHITSGEGGGRENADNRHYCNGYAFKTSWGWGEMTQQVKYTFPRETITGGLKKIRWSTEGSRWWCIQGQLQNREQTRIQWGKIIFARYSNMCRLLQSTSTYSKRHFQRF